MQSLLISSCYRLIISASFMKDIEIKLLLYPIFLLYSFVSLQFVLGNLNIPITDIFAMMLGIIFIWLLLVKVFIRKEIPQFCFKGISIYSLFLLVTILSIHNSVSLGASIKSFFRQPVFYFIVYFVSIGSLFLWTGKDKRQLIKYYQLLCTSAFLIAISSIITSFYRIYIGKTWANFEIPYLAHSHKVLAITLGIIIPFLIGMRLNIKTRVRGFYTLTIVISIIAIILSFSKAAWLIVVFILFIWEMRGLKKFKPVKPIVITITIIAIIGVAFYLFTVLSSNQEVIKAELSRYFLAALAVKLFVAHPIIGSGIGSFVIAMQDYADILPKMGYSSLLDLDVHGLVFKLLSETGLAGLLTFLTFLSIIFIWIYRLYQIHRQRGNIFWEHLLFGCLTGLLALFLLNSFFGTDTYTPRLWFPLAFIVGQGYLAENQVGSRQ
jgi:putative inorganic carbon (hco3(-)) transporter